MDPKPPRLLSLVLVPALLTLVVTVLRLIGEVRGWPHWLVGTGEAGGSGALLGISWLIFVFGLWFGIRVQRSGAGVPAPRRALLVSVLALVVLFGGIAICYGLGLVTFPDPDHPGEPVGMHYFLGLLVLGALVAFAAWPRIAWTMLVYAVLARVPVLVVTWLCLQYPDWNTHYTEIAPGLLPPPADELFLNLAMPQITFWPAITILFGTPMACLGAVLFGRARTMN